MRRTFLGIALLSQVIFFLGSGAMAAGPGITYQGRIFKPDGNPLEGSSVKFRMSVRSPGAENCLLYEEAQTINMAGSSGMFALTLNDGTGTRIDTATYSVSRIFANRATLTLDSTRCVSGTTYVPALTDGRKFVVYFKDETMSAYEPLPIMSLNYIPQSIYALESQKVGVFAEDNLLRAVDVSGNPVTAPALNPTQLSTLSSLLAGGSGSSYSTLTGAVGTSTIDNTNFAQTWNWSTATTQSPLTMASNALSTGSALTVSTSSAALNSSNGLINVSNSGASTNGILARFQSNSAAGSGLTVLANGNVGIGTTAPTGLLSVVGSAATGSSNAPKALIVVGGDGGPTAGNGGGISMTAGNAPMGSAGLGGGLDFTAGNGGTQGGDVLLTAGTAYMGGAERSTGGAISLLGGFPTADGGSIAVTAGHGGNGGGRGGDVSIAAGAGASGGVSNGGNIYLNGGAKTNPGFDGNVILANTRGNVGIGTASPASILDINTAVTPVTIRKVDSINPTRVMTLYENDNNGYIDQAGGGYLYLLSGGLDILSINGGGVTAQRQIVGNRSLLVNPMNASSLVVAVKGAAGQVANLQEWQNSSGGPLSVVASDGRVGIGTGSSPLQADLHVYGLSGSLHNILHLQNASSTAGSGLLLSFGNNSVNGATIEEGLTDGTNNAYLAFSTRGSNTLTEKLRIDPTGNVGVGTTSPQTTLQVAGVISPATDNTYTLGAAAYRFTQVYAANGVINTSDRREKKDVYNADLGLDFILKLRPVSYRWNTGVDNDVHYGLIAQEAEQAIAEVGKTDKTSIVTHDEVTDRYGVRYSELISPLIKAVQDVYHRLLGVDRELASVKSENAQLKQENANIKAYLCNKDKNAPICK